MQSLLQRNIGGLGKEIEDVVRRLLLTRQVSFFFGVLSYSIVNKYCFFCALIGQIKASTMKALGLSHVKGVLFYGPPGTGISESLFYCKEHSKLLLVKHFIHQYYH
jgi:hypothetical protein